MIRPLLGGLRDDWGKLVLKRLDISPAMACLIVSEMTQRQLQQLVRHCCLRRAAL